MSHFCKKQVRLWLPLRNCSAIVKVQSHGSGRQIGRVGLCEWADLHETWIVNENPLYGLGELPSSPWCRFPKERSPEWPSTLLLGTGKNLVTDFEKWHCNYNPEKAGASSGSANWRSYKWPPFFTESGKHKAENIGPWFLSFSPSSPQPPQAVKRNWKLHCKW